MHPCGKADRSLPDGFVIHVATLRSPNNFDELVRCAYLGASVEIV
jgi:hypothetical protein